DYGRFGLGNALSGRISLRNIREKYIPRTILLCGNWRRHRAHGLFLREEDLWKHQRGKNVGRSDRPFSLIYYLVGPIIERWGDDLHARPGNNDGPGASG